MDRCCRSRVGRLVFPVDHTRRMLMCLRVCMCGRVCAGPTVTEFLLLETAASFGLSDALQDAVAGAIGDAALIPLAQVKDLLVGAGVGLAAAKRIVGRLVRCAVLWCHHLSSCML